MRGLLIIPDNHLLGLYMKARKMGAIATAERISLELHTRKDKLIKAAA